jgi:prepilin-type N-terminal cleavage/methylation domain-containing protein
MTTVRTRLGFTLVEMLVVLVLLAVVSTVALPAFGGLLSGTPEEPTKRLLRAGRRRAIEGGLPVRVVVDSAHAVLFLPDGRAVGSGVAPFTGRVEEVSR